MRHSDLSFAALLALWLAYAPVAAAAPNAPSNAVVVPRYDATISLLVTWTDNANDEDNFEIQRRQEGGTFSFVATVGPNVTQFEDAAAAAGASWEYRVRARSAATGNSAWATTAAAMRPRQVWLMPDGDHDILHSFGTPLNFAGNQYFHEGWDVSSSNVRVDAARGGVVTGIGPGAGGQINLQVDMGSNGTVAENYLHITVDPALSRGDVVAPGTRVGTVRNDFFNRALEADHVHYGDASTNKLMPFASPEDRDPNEQPPTVADINNDGDDFIVVPADNNNHNQPREPAWGDVDFLVDAFDDMAPTNDLMAAPFSLGYWIRSGVARGDDVQSAANPYKLIQFDFGLIGASPAGAREDATVYWPLDADIQGLNTWQSTLTWILSNASDTTGASGTQQADELWRTDARAGSGTKANGSDALRARESQEARFPDGEYYVNIVLEDLENTTSVARKVLVDNARPYVKAVEVRSGEALAYLSEWSWDEASATLSISPVDFDTASTFPVGRTRNVNIEIEFSEPMQTAAVTVDPLGVSPVLSSVQSEGRRTVWRGTVSHLDIADDGSQDGQQTLRISGKDLAGNDLLQIGNRNDRGPNHHTRDATGAMQGASGLDTVHGFEIEPLEGLQQITAIFMRSVGVDPAEPTIEQKAQELTNWLNSYYSEVSYDTLSFNVTGIGWHDLDEPIDWYFTTPRSPLIDLVQEAITDAEDAGADLTGTNYVLVVTDETAPRDEWSTSGGWPYETDDGLRAIASGVLNLNSPSARVTNLTGRMVGLIDLFAYPEVNVSRAFVGPWSHMSDRDSAVHVLGWEKWRSGWVDEAVGAGKKVERIPKPAVAAPISNRTVTLGATDIDVDETKLLAIEIGDDLHYLAEYRRQNNLDGDLPDAGVVVSKANERVAQGEGPVILQESAVTAGDLDDAPFIPSGGRQTFDDPGSGVNLEVTGINTDTATVRLNYAVPPFENDVFVADHDDRWKTVDIWIDAPDLAGNFEVDPRDVMTAGENPVIGEVNKLVGRFRNAGAADATNFEVELEILEPWGTDGAWRQLDVATVPVLQGTVNNANDDFLIIADWTPREGVHTCVRLRARTVPNDINADNNFTQENIHEFTSTSGSPYEPVVSRFQVKNPFNERVPIFFRLDGLPEGWAALITPERPVLDPDQEILAQAVIQPADGAPYCLREEVTITAYAPRVDTLKVLGAITMATTLKSPGSVTHESWTDCNCDCGTEQRRQCRVYTRGCTEPAIPNTQIDILYTAPNGTKAIRSVNTDADGCFVDFVTTDPDPGVWETKVELPETQCRDGGRFGPVVVRVDKPPVEPDDACRKLKLHLAKLNNALAQAIDQRDDAALKRIFEQIKAILSREEECAQLADEFIVLYEDLIAAYFGGDEARTKVLLAKIHELTAV